MSVVKNGSHVCLLIPLNSLSKQHEIKFSWRFSLTWYLRILFSFMLALFWDYFRLTIHFVPPNVATKSSSSMTFSSSLLAQQRVVSVQSTILKAKFIRRFSKINTLKMNDHAPTNQNNNKNTSKTNSFPLNTNSQAHKSPKHSLLPFIMIIF